MIPKRHQCLRYIVRKLGTQQKYSYDQNMVAPRLIAAELLKKRKEDKQRGKSTILNTADIQVIGSNCQGHRPSVLVNSEGRAYMFNCGEGTQRNCYTNRIKLNNLEHLFVTNVQWPSLSGSYGLSLTLQDMGLPSFTLHGTEKVTDFFNSVKTFLSFTSGIECSARACNGSAYSDSGITIEPVILDRDPGSGDGDLKRMKKVPTLISYLCTLPDLPGTLDPRKCRDLGVPVGPKLAILKSGCDITLDDGTVIKSSDVCGAKSRGLQFVVIDCPSIEDIDLVTDNVMLCKLQQARKTEDARQIDIVVHFSPTEVYDNEKYIQWMNGFSEECKHILVANDEPKRPNFLDVYRSQYSLRQIDEDLFPELTLPLNFRDQQQMEQASSGKTDLDYGLNASEDLEIKHEFIDYLENIPRVYRASALDKFTIRPHASLYTADNRLSIDVPFRIASMLPDFDEDLKSYRDWRDTQSAPARHEPEIVFLGTGSALPSKLRNTSCILVNTLLPHRASIIMDCGEDSYGQMIRLFGLDKTNDILSHLKLIYISHHHPDHHIGLIEILSKMNKLPRSKPVLLLVPPGIDKHLIYYNENFNDLSRAYRMISTKTLKSKPSSGHVTDEIITSTVNRIRTMSEGLIQDIKVVGVEHCANSCATTIELKIAEPTMDTFKLSYSGDARPSEDFAMIGKDSDLLIHEATFDHRELSSALEKKHCTTTEAIAMARKMNAKYTILTHFSQRYPKVPYFTEDFDETIGYAFDNMTLRCPSHFARLPKMKRILSTMFSKSLYEIDARYSKTLDKKRLVSEIMERESSKG